MKTIYKVMLSILACGLIIFNISLSNSSEPKGEYSLKNIKVLQVSAGEAICDAKNSVECKIGNAVGTGHLIVYD
jgi:hypothetical protein